MRSGCFALRLNEKLKQSFLLSEKTIPIPADRELRADFGSTFGDACVSLDGYPIPILSPSGVMQIAAHEAIDVEVHERRGP